MSDEGTVPPDTGDTEVSDDTEVSPETGQVEARRPSGDQRSEGELSRLEREGDIAADYLEEFLDVVDADGDIDLDIEGGRAMVAVVGAELQHLVGVDGEVLDALQELTRLAVFRETGERSRLMLDIGGYRSQRRQEFVQLAEQAIAEVRRQQAPVQMKPMSPFARKVVHDTVAAAGLMSESEGEEPERRVVVRPA